jgi:protein-S-isoprenylcysteine O-methyltransferase Ste14
MKTRLKINGAIIILAVLVVTIFPWIFIRHNSPGFLDEVAEVFGIALILLGQIIRASSRGFKSINSSNGYTLIQSGPYSLVRNPMYLGIFLIGLGFVMMVFEWWATGIFLFIFSIRYILLIFQEEKKLLKLFSQEYRNYCQRVPRFIPSLRAIVKLDVREYLPLKPLWIKKEIGSIIGVLFGALLLESWEETRNEGWAIYIREAFILITIIMLFVLLFIYLSKITPASRNDVSNKN